MSISDVNKIINIEKSIWIFVDDNNEFDSWVWWKERTER
jgi:hypothetical protein